MKRTLSGKRSAWITPAGRSRGQCSASSASASPIRPPRLRSTASARAWVAFANSRQPSGPSALGRLSVKSLPARCSSASARPAAAQCAASGFRSETPFKKVRMAPERPLSVKRLGAVARAHRQGAGNAPLRQMLHQAQEEGQIVRS